MTATHFITAKTFHRKRLFQNQRFGELFTYSLMRWREQHGMRVHDYVIMPDHVHLLVTCDGEDVLGNVEKLQDAFALELAKQFGYGGEVWEPRCRTQVVEDANDCEKCTAMIESNPVRVGFCDKAGEYRMSSKSSRWVLDPLPEQLRKPELQTV
ncbi:MAG TPA: transposase [Candidatus Koribacter sp.]|jgi:putative transposase